MLAALKRPAMFTAAKYITRNYQQGTVTAPPLVYLSTTRLVITGLVFVGSLLSVPIYITLLIPHIKR